MTLTVTPANGYRVTDVTYTPTGGSATAVTMGAGTSGTYTGSLTMPDASVTVDVAYQQSRFIVTLQGPGGTVTTSPTSAYPGDAVTVTAAPGEDHQLEGVTYIPAGGGSAVAVTMGTNGMGGFTMPDASVTVAASFAPVPHEHTLVRTEAVAATCATVGNVAYWTCTGCGRHFANADGTSEVADGSWAVPAKAAATTGTGSGSASATTTSKLAQTGDPFAHLWELAVVCVITAAILVALDAHLRHRDTCENDTCL